MAGASVGTCASWTVTSIAAASGAIDSGVGIGAGGRVMVGSSTPMVIVVPSARTVDCTVGPDVGTGAPGCGTGALGSWFAVGAAEFGLWYEVATMTAPSDWDRDWNVVRAMLAAMRIAPMPTAPPTAHTALEVVRI